MKTFKELRENSQLNEKGWAPESPEAFAKTLNPIKEFEELISSSSFNKNVLIIVDIIPSEPDPKITFFTSKLYF